MGPSTSPANHVVFFPLSVRSHIRPSLAFVLNILEVHRSVVVTTIVSSDGAGNFNAELDLLDRSYLDSLDFESRFQSIEIALPARDANGPPRLEGPALSKALLDDGLLDRLWRGQEGTGAYARTPCFVLADALRFLARSDVHATNERLGQSPTPVWHMSSTFGFALVRFFLPVDDGGFASGIEQRFQQYLADGMNEREAVIKAFRHASGKIVNIPNLPPMYDYEFTPQTGSRVMDKGLISFFSIIFKSFHNSDGIFDLGIPELDEECRDRFRELTGVGSLGVGFQYNEKAWELAAPAAGGKANDAEDQRVLSFLDDAQRQYGSHSVIYISFGTLTWPELRPEIFETVIDTLLALHPPAPFVFATAAAKEGQLSAEYVAKVENSERGIISPWVPQVKVLKHPATAAVLSHGGCGTLTEAILAGVPLIFLPFSADQPANAMYFTKTQPIGITLYQMASGCDGEPRYDGPTINSTPEAMQEELTAAISAVRGAKGAEFRQRISEVMQLIKDSKARGGARDAVMSLNRFFS